MRRTSKQMDGIWPLRQTDLFVVNPLVFPGLKIKIPLEEGVGAQHCYIK
jgi:hypothetical protein